MTRSEFISRLWSADKVVINRITASSEDIKRLSEDLQKGLTRVCWLGDNSKLEVKTSN